MAINNLSLPRHVQVFILAMFQFLASVAYSQPCSPGNEPTASLFRIQAPEGVPLLRRPCARFSPLRGKITNPTSTVYVGDAAHSVYYFDKKFLAEAPLEIMELRLPQSIMDSIQRSAVEQAVGPANLGLPTWVDRTQPGRAWGLPKEYIRQINDALREGTASIRSVSIEELRRLSSPGTRILPEWAGGARVGNVANRGFNVMDLPSRSVSRASAFAPRAPTAGILACGALDIATIAAGTVGEYIDYRQSDPYGQVIREYALSQIGDRNTRAFLAYTGTRLPPPMAPPSTREQTELGLLAWAWARIRSAPIVRALGY